MFVADDNGSTTTKTTEITETTEVTDPTFVVAATVNNERPTTKTNDEIRAMNMILKKTLMRALFIFLR